MARISLVCSLACLIFHPGPVFGASVSLTWNPSASANAAGYTLYYGMVSGHYTSSLDAGTNTTMTVTGLAAGQTYYFAAAAYGMYGVGSPLSSEITETMPIEPLLAAQPVSQGANAGTTVVLFVDVIADPPLSFQWFDGGAAITGATNALLELPQISPEQAGSYSVVVSSAGGSVTSAVAAITVLNSAPAPMTGTQQQPPGSKAPPAPVAVYNGLFYLTNAAGDSAVTVAAAGMLANCVVEPDGNFSARLDCAGHSYSFCGALNTAGDGAEVIARTEAGLSNLNVTLHTDPVFGAGPMTGTVSNMDTADPWVAPLTACRATNAYWPAAQFVLISPPPPDQSGSVEENYTCQFTVASNGVVSLIGQLGDGTPVSQTAAIDGDGSFPIYVSLYNQGGLLAGWVNLASGVPVGNLTWIRPADPWWVPSGQAGFTEVLDFITGPDSSSTSFRLSQ